MNNDSLQNIFGKITPPPGTPADITDPQVGLFRIIRVGLELVVVVAALFMLFNLIVAGYSYIFSNGDPKKVGEANMRITYAIMGLAIIVLTPLIAGIVGIVMFGRFDAILNPDIIKTTP